MPALSSRKAKRGLTMPALAYNPPLRLDVCSGACLTINKVRRTVMRYSKFVSKNGEVLIIDNHKVRLSRMRKKVGAWSKANNDGQRIWMVTLTYKDVDGWRPNHIREYMKKVREKYGKKLKGYAWVSEIQKRGAVHYHVLLKMDCKPAMPDKSGMWVHGMSRVELARTSYYLMAYTGKEYQKEFGKYPKGCRLFGISDTYDVMMIVRYAGLTRFLKHVVDSEGWGAVKFYRAMISELNGWTHCKSFDFENA